MDDELSRYTQIRAWNLARTMVANGASPELVALTFVRVAEGLLPTDKPDENQALHQATGP